VGVPVAGAGWEYRLLARGGGTGCWRGWEYRLLARVGCRLLTGNEGCR